MDERERLQFLRDSGCRIVELGLVKLDVFEKEINRIDWTDLRGFDYVSLHAPVAKYGHNDQTHEIFAKIRKMHGLSPFNLIVVHPDTVEDFSVFEMCGGGLPFAFENMDKRKAAFKSVYDLVGLKILSEFKMVLDVNHACTNDPTLALTSEFYEKLGDRIVQIHLSGYTGYHEPLFQTKQVEIIKSIQNLDAPIIVEGILEPKEVTLERDYILEILQVLHGA